MLGSFLAYVRIFSVAKVVSNAMIARAVIGATLSELNISARMFTNPVDVTLTGMLRV
jgi:hypothetical protein